MKQWIIVGGIEYLLESNVPLTQEQIEYTVSQLSVKTLSKTCISAATVGQTIKLENTILSGTPPYNVSFKKDGQVMQSWTATTLTVQSISYILQPTNIGTRRFSVDVTDSCSTGAKSTTEFCDVLVTAEVITGSISFSSSPQGAQIYLDDVLQSAHTNAIINDVLAGSHSYIIRLTGYYDATGTVIVTAGQTTTVPLIILVPIVTTGILSFSSSPSGAEIYIDNIDQLKTTGASPINISVSPGTHTWKLTLSGYNDATGSQLVTAGQTYTINPTLTPIVTTVCTWITGKGGWTAISAYNIMELVSGYSGATSLGFTVTAAHIMGAVAYYSDNLSSGNNLTGCGFT